MNEDRIWKCLPQVQKIRGHLWHRYSITVNQIHGGERNTFEVMTSGGFRGGARGVRPPPKIRKAYVIQR
jgi:hypothetical protein